MLTPDQRRQTGAAQRLEAPHRGTFPYHPPRPGRPRKTFQVLPAEIDHLEQLAKQTLGVGCDQYRTRLGDRLQPRRQIRGRPDHRLLLGRVRARHLPNHHLPGRNADPSLQAHTFAWLQPGDRRHQFEPGAYRPLRIVLMGARIAEIDQDAVTHVAGDIALPALDHRLAAGLERADHVAHVLGIETRRQLGRADQIGEHHRQLPPLGMDPAPAPHPPRPPVHPAPRSRAANACGHRAECRGPRGRRRRGRRARRNPIAWAVKVAAYCERPSRSSHCSIPSGLPDCESLHRNTRINPIRLVIAPIDSAVAHSRNRVFGDLSQTTCERSRWRAARCRGAHRARARSPP